MTLATTAASMGLKVLGKALQDPQTRGQIKDLAQQAGRLVAGKGFANAVEKGLAKLQGLAGENPTGQAPPVLRSVNTELARSALNYFDADRNGQVSKTELSEGVQNLERSGLAGRGVFNQLHQAGWAMLEQYDGVSALDGQTGGISTDDITHLAALDGTPRQLSAADLQRLSQSLS